jgi:hypothetical protein
MYLHFLVHSDGYYFGTNILTSHHMQKKEKPTVSLAFKKKGFDLP